MKSRNGLFKNQSGNALLIVMMIASVSGLLICGKVDIYASKAFCNCSTNRNIISSNSNHNTFLASCSIGADLVLQWIRGTVC